jgi:hypothetical protein
MRACRLSRRLQTQNPLALNLLIGLSITWHSLRKAHERKDCADGSIDKFAMYSLEGFV